MNVPDAHGIGLNTIIALLSLFSLLIVFGMNYIRFPTDIISAIGKKNNDKNKTKLKRDLLFFFFIVDLFGIGLVFELWLIFLFHSIFIFTDLGCISKFIIPLVSFIWIIYLVCRGIKLRKEQMKDWKPKITGCGIPGSPMGPPVNETRLFKTLKVMI